MSPQILIALLSIFIIGQSDGSSAFAESMAQSDLTGTPKMSSDRRPPFDNDPLMKRAMESNNDDIREFIRNYAETHGGPKSFKDKAFRDELTNKLDGLDSKDQKVDLASQQSTEAAIENNYKQPKIQSLRRRNFVNLEDDELDDLETKPRRRRRTSFNDNTDFQGGPPQGPGNMNVGASNSFASILGMLVSAFSSSMVGIQYGGYQQPTAYGNNFGPNMMFGVYGSQYRSQLPQVYRAPTSGSYYAGNLGYQAGTIYNGQYSYGNYGGWNYASRLPSVYRAP